MQANLVYRVGAMGTDTGTTGVVDAVSDTMAVGCEDLDNISIMVNQITDAGTPTIIVEKTYNGVDWVQVGNALAGSDFPAGANTAKEIPLSDSNAMPLITKGVRIRMTVVGGSFTVGVAGKLRLEKRKLSAKDATMTVDTGTTGQLDQVGDIAQVDVQGLENIVAIVKQVTDAGTPSLTVEKTFDGTNWALVTTLTDPSFPAGANTYKEVTLSDGNGMPTLANKLRLVMGTAGGSYSLQVAGKVRDGYSG